MLYFEKQLAPNHHILKNTNYCFRSKHIDFSDQPNQLQTNFIYFNILSAFPFLLNETFRSSIRPKNTTFWFYMYVYFFNNVNSNTVLLYTKAGTYTYTNWFYILHVITSETEGCYCFRDSHSSSFLLLGLVRDWLPPSRLSLPLLPDAVPPPVPLHAADHLLARGVEDEAGWPELVEEEAADQGGLLGALQAEAGAEVLVTVTVEDGVGAGVEQRKPGNDGEKQPFFFAFLSRMRWHGA